jgi:hypothetical protein
MLKSILLASVVAISMGIAGPAFAGIHMGGMGGHGGHMGGMGGHGGHMGGMGGHMGGHMGGMMHHHWGGGHHWGHFGNRGGYIGSYTWSDGTVYNNCYYFQTTDDNGNVAWVPGCLIDGVWQYDINSLN